MAKYEEITQDDLDKMEAALERYKKENEKFRTQRDEYKAAAENGEVNQKFKKSALTAEAKLRINALGIKNPERILKYVNLDDVEFDDEGQITGIDEKIDAVKTDFPELFDVKRIVGGKADAGERTPVEATKSPTEMQLAQLFGD